MAKKSEDGERAKRERRSRRLGICPREPFALEAPEGADDSAFLKAFEAAVINYVEHGPVPTFKVHKNSPPFGQG